MANNKPIAVRLYFKIFIFNFSCKLGLILNAHSIAKEVVRQITLVFFDLRNHRLALIAKSGEMGYATAMTAPNWGFQDVLYGGNPVTLRMPLDAYVMENILFKIAFPAEFHAQTAVECALELHDQVKDRIDDIKEVVMETQEPGVRIIDKKGPLNNFADRDHCLQYMAAIGLIFGELTADHYTDTTASDPRIDALREKMTVSENEKFTKEYYDLDKRAIGNAITVHFNDGSSTDRVEVEYPIGHRVRREEGIPVLVEKFKNASAEWFGAEQAGSIVERFDDAGFNKMPASEFMELFVKSQVETGAMLA